MMETHSSIFRKNRTLFLFMAVMAVIAIWQFLQRENINNSGVILKALILKTETMKGGFMTTLKYEYMNRSFIKSTRSKYGNSKKGDFYFIKVLPNDPHEMILL